MFSTLQYSYAAGDEYDTRKFKKNNFIYFVLIILVPPLPPQMKVPPKKAVKYLFFLKNLYQTNYLISIGTST